MNGANNNLNKNLLSKDGIKNKTRRFNYLNKRFLGIKSVTESVDNFDIANTSEYAKKIESKQGSWPRLYYINEKDIDKEKKAKYILEHVFDKQDEHKKSGTNYFFKFIDCVSKGNLLEALKCVDFYLKKKYFVLDKNMIDAIDEFNKKLLESHDNKFIKYALSFMENNKSSLCIIFLESFVYGLFSSKHELKKEKMDMQEINIGEFVNGLKQAIKFDFNIESETLNILVREFNNINKKMLQSEKYLLGDYDDEILSLLEYNKTIIGNYWSESFFKVLTYLFVSSVREKAIGRAFKYLKLILKSNIDVKQDRFINMSSDFDGFNKILLKDKSLRDEKFLAEIKKLLDFTRVAKDSKKVNAVFSYYESFYAVLNKRFSFHVNEKDISMVFKYLELVISLGIAETKKADYFHEVNKILLEEKLLSDDDFEAINRFKALDHKFCELYIEDAKEHIFGCVKKNRFDDALEYLDLAVKLFADKKTLLFDYLLGLLKDKYVCYVENSESEGLKKISSVFKKLVIIGYEKEKILNSCLKSLEERFILWISYPKPKKNKVEIATSLLEKIIKTKKMESDKDDNSCLCDSISVFNNILLENYGDTDQGHKYNKHINNLLKLVAKSKKSDVGFFFLRSFFERLLILFYDNLKNGKDNIANKYFKTLKKISGEFNKTDIGADVLKYINNRFDDFNKSLLEDNNFRVRIYTWTIKKICGDLKEDGVTCIGFAFVWSYLSVLRDKFYICVDNKNIKMAFIYLRDFIDLNELDIGIKKGLYEILGEVLDRFNFMLLEDKNYISGKYNCDINNLKRMPCFVESYLKVLKNKFYSCVEDKNISLAFCFLEKMIETDNFITKDNFDMLRVDEFIKMLLEDDNYLKNRYGYYVENLKKVSFFVEFYFRALVNKFFSIVRNRDVGVAFDYLKRTMKVHENIVGESFIEALFKDKEYNSLTVNERVSIKAENFIYRIDRYKKLGFGGKDLINKFGSNNELLSSLKYFTNQLNFSSLMSEQKNNIVDLILNDIFAIKFSSEDIENNNYKTDLLLNLSYANAFMYLSSKQKNSVMKLILRSIFVPTYCAVLFSCDYTVFEKPFSNRVLEILANARSIMDSGVLILNEFKISFDRVNQIYMISYEHGGIQNILRKEIVENYLYVFKHVCRHMCENENKVKDINFYSRFSKTCDRITSFFNTKIDTSNEHEYVIKCDDWSKKIKRSQENFDRFKVMLVSYMTEDENLMHLQSRARVADEYKIKFADEWKTDLVNIIKFANNQVIKLLDQKIDAEVLDDIVHIFKNLVSFLRSASFGDFEEDKKTTVSNIIYKIIPKIECNNIYTVTQHEICDLAKNLFDMCICYDKDCDRIADLIKLSVKEFKKFVDPKSDLLVLNKTIILFRDLLFFIEQKKEIKLLLGNEIICDINQINKDIIPKLINKLDKEARNKLTCNKVTKEQDSKKDKIAETGLSDLSEINNKISSLFESLHSINFAVGNKKETEQLFDAEKEQIDKTIDTQFINKFSENIKSELVNNETNKKQDSKKDKIPGLQEEDCKGEKSDGCILF